MQVTFKPVLWIWLAGPFFELGVRALFQQLGPNPQEALLRGLGQQTLVLLLLVVAMPFLARWLVPSILVFRRMVGLFAFFYASIHLLAFWVFEHGLVLRDLLHDALTRPFVAVGLGSLALLAPLALTSNRFSMRRLGPRWKLLHRLIWPALGFGILHYALHKSGKNDFDGPLLAAAALLVVVLTRPNRAGARTG